MANSADSGFPFVGCSFLYRGRRLTSGDIHERSSVKSRNGTFAFLFSLVPPQPEQSTKMSTNHPRTPPDAVHMGDSASSMTEKLSTTPRLSSQDSTHSESREPPTLPPLEKVKVAFQPGRGFMLAFVSICIVTLAAAIDATSLSIALPIITEKLRGSAIDAFWSGTSFLVTSAVFQPVIAGMSHVFGRKHLVLASSLFFAVGSLVAAVSTNFTMMYVYFVAFPRTSH